MDAALIPNTIVVLGDITCWSSEQFYPFSCAAVHNLMDSRRTNKPL